MTLGNVLDQISQLHDYEVVFAKRPWTLASDAEIGRLDSEFRVPKAISDSGFAYFLEVSIAREVLEVFGNRQPSHDECRSLLMYYAENDAYPDWVYRT